MTTSDLALQFLYAAGMLSLREISRKRMRGEPVPPRELCAVWWDHVYDLGLELDRRGCGFHWCSGAGAGETAKIRKVTR